MASDSSKFQAGVGDVFSESTGQVIDLCAYRYRLSRSHLVWYINQNGSWSNLLAAFKFLQVDEIGTREELNSRLLAKRPDLILVESSVRWASPIKIIEQLQDCLQVPMIMIYEQKQKPSNPALIKRAYAAGVCDTLYAPLQSQDLLESLQVLLKFQKHVSNQQ